MQETGVLLGIIALLQLVCVVLASVFILASVFAGMKSSDQRASRVDVLKRTIKRLRYTKVYTLLLIISSACGVVLSVANGIQSIFWANLLCGLLFLFLFLTIRSLHKLKQKELESAEAVLFGKSDCL